MSRSIELESQTIIGAQARPVKRGALVEVLEGRAAAVVLVVLALLGFGLRASGINEIGFAEDEINKLEAVRAYERGEITPNAEHPMMMKGLIFFSMQAARWWNQSAGHMAQISDEAAVRFPNILFGTLTVFPLFLLTMALFNRRTALLAAALWALGINAMTYNRIAKEDTLLVFFMLFAFYFYIRAKQTSGFDAPTKRRHYIFSAASFGFMLASKYFPHYFGLNMLYHHIVRLRERAPGEPRGKTPAIFYLVVAIAFIVANPALFVPQTWNYLLTYSSEQLLTHHGYLMGATLYENTMSKTPFGATPIYFYLLFLAIKLPLPLLIALIAGLFEIARRRKEPGAAFLVLMFVLWIVPYSLVGSKWLRYTLSLMPFAYMIAALGIMALVRWCASLWPTTGNMSTAHPTSHATTTPATANTVSLIASATATIIFIAWPAFIAYAHAPHYALYTNALAASRAGYFFPHDEFYDDGLREALKFVSEHAPRGASVAHETPGVARYYLEKFGRTDLHSRVISDPQFDVRSAGHAFVILQRGRTYFENREEMDAVRTNGQFRRVYEGMINGVSAVEVYALSQQARE